MKNNWKWLCWVIGHKWNTRKGKWTLNPEWKRHLKSIGREGDWLFKREDILPEDGYVTCKRCGKRERGTKRALYIGPVAMD
jgi:hypothetical protein